MKKSSNNIDLSDFSKKFLKNEDCLEYFKKIRWKRGFVCPYCGKKPCWTIAPNKYKYKCRNCGRQTSVTAGTFFHGTHLTMLQWFRAIYYCCKEGDDATAKELKSEADIGSYRIAQSTLKKIKGKMNLNDIDKLERTNSPLHGDVIIRSYRISINNTHEDIVIAIEYNGKKTGRIQIYKETEWFLQSEYLTTDINTINDKSYTDRIRDDFIEWCKGKKIKNFTALSGSYCLMYNRWYTFNTVLENMAKP